MTVSYYTGSIVTFNTHVKFATDSSAEAVDSVVADGRNEVTGNPGH